MVERNVWGSNLRRFLAAAAGVMIGPLSRIPNAQKGTSHETTMLRRQINCDPPDENNDSTPWCRKSTYSHLAFLSHLPACTRFVHSDCYGIMPLKNPNVGDKSSQFSTDYPTSSITAVRGNFRSERTSLVDSV
jgi:hypothetical protein